MKNAIILQEYELKCILENILENIPYEDLQDSEYLKETISNKLLDVTLNNGATHLIIQSSDSQIHIFDLTYKEDIENLFAILKELLISYRKG
ncbi:MAG: hypothetical protein ACK4FM_00590 [Caldimicrobium sp.]